jgi:Flp pilus assembly pilin Flp
VVKLLRRLWIGNEGQDLVEYGLLLVLVALMAIAGMKVLAGAINGTFGSAAQSVASPGGP